MQPEGKALRLKGQKCWDQSKPGLNALSANDQFNRKTLFSQSVWSKCWKLASNSLRTSLSKKGQSHTPLCMSHSVSICLRVFAVTGTTSSISRCCRTAVVSTTCGMKASPLSTSWWTFTIATALLRRGQCFWETQNTLPGWAFMTHCFCSALSFLLPIATQTVHAFREVQTVMWLKGRVRSVEGECSGKVMNN